MSTQQTQQSNMEMQTLNQSNTEKPDADSTVVDDQQTKVSEMTTNTDGSVDETRDKEDTASKM